MEMGPSRNRSNSSPVNLPAKLNPLAVVVHYELLDGCHPCDQFYHDMGSLGMFFYIVECFPVIWKISRQNAVWSAQPVPNRSAHQGDSGFVAVPLGESAHQVNQISALHPERTEVVTV